MYNIFHASKGKKFVFNCSRRLGKSYLLCVIAIETALSLPNAQIKYAAPTQKAVRKIIIPLMRQILETCPKHLRPKFNKIDGTFEFPHNGSEIHLAGTEQAQADNLRGTACDLAIIDEAGFASDLEYIIESILMPQMLTRPNARLLMASTPPPTPDHPFLRYANKAMEEQAYAKYTIYDNPLLTKEKIEEFKIEAGGDATTTWRREYMAEFVTDTDSALFPEATDDLMAAIIREVPQPQFFNPTVAIDLGFLDYTGVVFGYYDFVEAKIVIEDELLINKSTTEDIVALAKIKERTLWGEKQPRRVVDGNPMAIADLNSRTMHNYRCHAPEKTDLVSNVNRVRIDLGNMTILVHPRCENLINQLKYATWNKQRNAFSRGSNSGHWDLCAALIYLCKAIDRKTNPVPPGFGWDRANAWGVPTKNTNTSHATLRAMFSPNRR